MEDFKQNYIIPITQMGQAPTIQYQTADGSIIKTNKLQSENKQEQPATFIYQNQGNTLLQPVSGYNYIVNNVGGGTIGFASVDQQGRLIINQNKAVTTAMPMPNLTAISFKCDVCSGIFQNLNLLNAHKRIHTQDGSDQQQQQQHNNETLVVGPGIVQTQNVVTENGQIGQIQIISPENLEAIQQQQQNQQQNQQQQHNETNVVDKTMQKCQSCSSFLVTGKRKGPKATRCEACATNDQQMPQENGQMFITQNGTPIKYEIHSTNETSTDSMGNSLQIISASSLQQDQDQNIDNFVIEQADNTNGGLMLPPGTTLKREAVCPAPGHHPVKKRNAQQLSKCSKCNGSGYVYMQKPPPVPPVDTKHNIGAPVKPEKQFNCNICGGNFSRYSSLWSHRKLHSGEKNYKCSVCGLAFAKAVYLKNHSRIHTGEKPYKCQTCGMQFSQSPHLKNHERTHSGERPYVCEVCDKGFARHATLWNHRRIHTGEKPYKCEICNSAFSQAAHLKNHAKVHSGEKPYSCDICSASFADRFALKRHRNIHVKYGQTAPRQRNQTQQNDSSATATQKQEPENDDSAAGGQLMTGL